MANDPPAPPSVPELADLDPAFDLTTFAAEGDNADRRGRTRLAPAGEAAVSDAEMPRFEDLPWNDAPIVPAGSPDDARPWLTESRIQLAAAGVLAVGGIAIMLLAFRGSHVPPAPRTSSSKPPVAAPLNDSAATAAAAPAVAPAPTAAASAPEQPTTAVPVRESTDAGQAQVQLPSSRRARASDDRRATTPASTTGRRARPSPNPRTDTRRAAAAAAAPVQPWAAAATIEQSTMNVNAVPWAEVWVDGRPVGETPLANIRVPVGDHEVVFRHPELGERRVRAVVEAGVPARVTVDLRR